VQKRQEHAVPVEPFGFVHGHDGELAGARVAIVALAFNGLELLGSDDLAQSIHNASQRAVSGSLPSDPLG